MAKIEWKPEPNINRYRECLMQGYIGQVEYHLFKDNSWIAWLYKTEQEKQDILAELKSQKYSIDYVCDFKKEVISLTNKIEVTLN